jgi:hypothetical protein
MKWSFCDTYIRKIENVDELTLSEPMCITTSKQNLLGRCTPIVFNGQTILPLYDEVSGCCVLYAGSGFDYDQYAIFGTNEIQPAIWENDGEIFSLTRNFRSENLYSKLHQVSDFGLPFPVVGDSVTTVPNNNSSIAVLKTQNAAFYVFNNTTGRRRCKISVGLFVRGEFHTFWELDSYGSYPCIVKHDGGFAISYTTFHKTIAVVWIEANQLFNKYCSTTRSRNHHQQENYVF